MPQTIDIQLSGRQLEPRLPALLTSASRSGGAAADPFLPPGYLIPTSAFDVSAGARSATDATADLKHAAADDEIVVLELADGSTFITSAERLRASLQHSRPELLGPNGEILIDRLREDGGAGRNVFTKAVGGLVSKVFTFAVGGAADDPVGEAVKGVAEVGISWAGTKALMWAIESRLEHEAGLYRWVGASGSTKDFEPAALTPPKDAAQAAKNPLLVFVHGTGSSTLGSFGELRATGQDVWAALEARFGQRIYAFEHKTLSESPITNALQLVRALPKGSHVNLVSHSRGGLVADLLCLSGFDDLIDRYEFGFEGVGDPSAETTKRVIGELGTAHAEHRAELRLLAAELRDKQLVIQRYVRAASPAHGTLLASGNFDLFLSGLLTLIGQAPFLFGSPYYSAFKRVVIDIAKNRTNPHLVPGIEAMLPDSPMAWLLREAPVRKGIQMAVIAGDIQGGNLLKRLGVLLTDFIFFDNVDNDLVVDTPAMLAGIAPKAGSRVLFDRGADVSHFRYFTNHDTRAALRDWLVSDKPAELTVFRALPSRFEDLQALRRAASRDAQAADRPVVVVLPGVMGSHLQVNGSDRVWFDPLDIASGGLEKIGWDRPKVEAEELFSKFYGRLCGELAKTHRVETFPYDWRQPLDVLAERLGEFLARLMKQTDKPIRLLAHSMGGLVVRACIHKRRAVMDELMQRDGARLVMLGTPNQGAHSMVENLLGKGATLRMLVRLDLNHSMQEVLDIVAGFRGALQLLPKRDFKDTFQGPEGGDTYDYQTAKTWADFNAKVRDLWFGDHKSGQPDQSVLDAANWLWKADGDGTPKLPAEYEKKASYVFGVARNTPCGVRDENGRLRMVGTTRGDGTVTWDSGRIGGIGQFYYMQAEHGDLPATKEHFPALVELLTSGSTGQLLKQPPATRDAGPAKPLLYDAGPPTADDPDSIERTLLGGSQRQRAVARPKRRLEVSVRAVDLRFVTMPVMVGHYERDPIAGPEGLIDRELLDGDLSERSSLGLYAGPRGTATVVLRPPNSAESARGSMSGAIVIGLGSYDVPLNAPDLTEAVRTGVLRYLLQVIDVLGKGDLEVPLASLLIGYNSSANLSIGASVEALIQGVVDANARFYETTRLNIRVSRLEIVELYLDTAITAVYALRQMAETLAAQAETAGTLLVCRSELQRDESARLRLFDDRAMSYWPRLVVTDADRRDELCPPECFRSDGPPGWYGETSKDRDADPDGEPPTDPRAPIADRLRYIYIGARARAEAVAQQRQPGLIETLVTQQIHVNRYQEDIGRMLFQLMVPHDFKDAARQLDRLVLVVDSTTSNLPWELMLADDPTGRSDDKRPLALRTAVVRQFVSSKFRRQVRQVMNHTALVIGNPSVAGFGPAFPLPKGDKRKDPPALDHAETEAEAIALTLNGLGYQVTQAIGAEVRAIDVFARLYHQPYRILHISAHGVFGVRHQDGRLRSGVVLSDGLLITAAEIAAMESVPELVFLNCCHLGTVDQPIGRGANKLAASVARELIDIGVRCVIVAGWAVDDRKAAMFGQTFYEELLLRRRNFGDAVFRAREAVWKVDPGDITWGAFQAYGEPAWLAEPRVDGSGAGDGDKRFVSPDELLDALARVRAALSSKTTRQTETALLARGDHIQELLDSRALPAWRTLPEVQSALGSTWRQLGRLDQARQAFLAAIQAEVDIGRVPVKDIEQLANVEALLGQRIAKDDPSGKSDDEAMRYIDLAISRLKRLGEIVVGKVDLESAAEGVIDPSREQTEPVMDPSRERSALLGSAWKRKAGLYALQLRRGKPTAADAARIGQKMEKALMKGVAAYRDAEGSSESGRLSPYHALNRLALDSLTPWPSSELKDAAIALAQRCRQQAAQMFATDSNIWNAAMQADALLVERLIDGSFGAANDQLRKAAFDEVAKAYTEGFSNLTIKPSEFESVVAQVELLARFFAAKEVAGHEAVLKRTAKQLGDLMSLLQPARRRDGETAAGDESAEGAEGGEDGDSDAAAVPMAVTPSPASVAPKPAEKTARGKSAAKAPAAKAPARKRPPSRRRTGPRP